MAVDHEEEDLTAAHLTRVVGRRAVPLNDCGGVDGAALLTWRLIGELVDWDGKKKPPKDALAILTDSNAPLLGCSLEALVRAQPAACTRPCPRASRRRHAGVACPQVTDQSCPEPVEGHGLAHLGPDLGKLRKWHTTYVQKVKAELATATARVDGVDQMLGQCVVKQAADPTTGDVPNPCVKGPAQHESRCMWASRQWKNVEPEPASTIKPTPTSRHKKPLTDTYTHTDTDTDTGMGLGPDMDTGTDTGMDLSMQAQMWKKKMMMKDEPEEMLTATEFEDPAGVRAPWRT